MAELKKIVIDIDGVKLGLSLESAEELRDILVDLLGAKEKTVYVPTVIRERYYPYWGYWSNSEDTLTYTITCGSTSGNTLELANN